MLTRKDNLICLASISILFFKVHQRSLLKLCSHLSPKARVSHSLLVSGGRHRHLRWPPGLLSFFSFFRSLCVLVVVSSSVSLRLLDATTVVRFRSGALLVLGSDLGGCSTWGRCSAPPYLCFFVASWGSVRMVLYAVVVFRLEWWRVVVVGARICCRCALPACLQRWSPWRLSRVSSVISRI